MTDGRPSAHLREDYDEVCRQYNAAQARIAVLENALFDAEHYLSDIKDDDDVSALRRHIMEILSPTKEPK